MGISSVGGCQAAVQQTVPSRQTDGEQLAQALREQRASQPTLSDMMQEAREQAAKREELFKIPKNSRRYGDSTILANSKLARARTHAEVDAASGYARRQIAQLRAAKQNDSENADRIQAAINQLQKVVNRSGRKKRELSQEKTAAVRQARLEKEKRTREAKRQRNELRRRQAQRIIRESGYLREADVDNHLQDQLAASRLALRSQMQELSAQPSRESAIQGYAASAASEPPPPEVSVQA